MRIGEYRRRVAAWSAILLLPVVGGGCAISQAHLLHPNCRRVQQGDALQSLQFSVTAETRGMVGDQLIYEVSLYNVAGRPIASTDRRYRNRVGAIAARKTLMVLTSPCTFEHLQLVIPAEELQIQQGDWPVSAVFRLYSVAGECVADAACVVPAEPRSLVATPRRGRPAATQPVVKNQSPATRPHEQAQRKNERVTTNPAEAVPRGNRALATRPAGQVPRKDQAATQPARQPPRIVDPTNTRPATAAQRTNRPPTTQSAEVARSKSQIPATQPATQPVSRPVSPAPGEDRPLRSRPTKPRGRRFRTAL